MYSYITEYIPNFKHHFIKNSNQEKKNSVNNYAYQKKKKI